MTTAVAEYSTTEAALADLRNRFGKVVYNVATPKGLEDAKKARAEVRGYRTSLEAKRKEIKAPALERCRLIDAEAQRITAELVAIEGPIDEQIKAEETRKENERLAKVAAEVKRVEEIKAGIETIRQMPVKAAGARSAADAKEWLDRALAIEIDDSFAEFKTTAQSALVASVESLRNLHTQRVIHEEAQAKLKVEQDALAEQRRAEDEKQAKERTRIAEEERQAKAKREAEESAAHAAREEADRKAAAEREAARKKHDEELAAQRAEQDRKDREAAQARQAEEKRLADQRAEQDRRQAELDAADRKRREEEAVEQRKKDEAARKAQIKRPSEDEVVAVVAEHFQVDVTVAADWLHELFTPAEEVS